MDIVTQLCYISLFKIDMQFSTVTCVTTQYCTDFSLSDNEAAEEDSDVVKERQLVIKHKYKMIEESPVVISGLSKNYGTFKAVENLYLEIDRNECFGLLGKPAVFTTQNLISSLCLPINWLL